MPRNKDVLWEHIIQEGRKVKCKFCHEVFVGGITRMRYHFANTCSKDIRPCKAVPDSIRDIALKGVKELELKSKRHKTTRLPKSCDSSLGSILQSGDVGINAVQVYNPKPTKKTETREADKAIIKYIVNTNLSFDILKSSEFREVCIAVAKAGSGYNPPSNEHTCRKLLMDLKDEADMYVSSIKRIWNKSGCTLMLDLWAEGNETSYLHIFAGCPKGIVYLKSLFMDEHAMDDQYIFDFVSSVIDEIGPQYVVQFISEDPNFDSVGFMIEEKYPNTFKVKCASHCVDLMLKELETLDSVIPVLESAKKIVHFVFNHQYVLNLMRTHTNRYGFKSTTTTRFSTNFTYLRSLLKEEHALRHIVDTVEWKDSTPCKSAEGTEVQNMIQDAIFWDYAKELMHAVEPLVKILKMVDHGGSTLGYIYYAINKVKKVLKEFCRGDSKYQNFWKIIDDKWNNFLYSDIHAAAAYLNPHLFHDGHVKLDSDVKIGLEKVIQRMVFNSEERMKIAEELRDYHSLDPRIFGLMAVDALHVSHPRIWWDMWGSSVPILQSLAIKVLSQPCSFMNCEKKWSDLESMYTKKKDHLDVTMSNNLLYVRMNIHLMNTTLKSEKVDLKPIDFDKIEAFPDEMEEFGLVEYREETTDDKEDEIDES